MNENNIPNGDKNGSVPFDHETSRRLEERITNENHLKSGANWFFWVAGLSLINTILILAGVNWGIGIGLAISQIVDIIAYGVAHEYSTNVSLYFAFIIDMVAAGIFVYIGYLARQKKEYAFIAGMALYAVDGSFYFTSFSIIGLGVHAIALFFMYRGYQALTKMNKARANNTGPAGAMPTGLSE